MSRLVQGVVDFFSFKALGVQNGGRCKEVCVFRAR